MEGCVRMGSGFSMACPHCGYEKEVLLGVGVLYWSLSNVIGQVPRSMRNRVQKALAKHPGCKEEFSHKLYRCPKCERRAPRFFFKLSFGNGEVLEPGYRCGHCRGRLEMLPDPKREPPEDLAQWPCPRCGKTGMHGLESSDWD